MTLFNNVWSSNAQVGVNNNVYINVNEEISGNEISDAEGEPNSAVNKKTTQSKPKCEDQIESSKRCALIVNSGNEKLEDEVQSLNENGFSRIIIE